MNKKAIQALIATFETGKPVGDFVVCECLPDGAGPSYGYHQATQRTLYEIVRRYCRRGGKYANALRAYLARLKAGATKGIHPDNIPDWVNHLMALLRLAGAEKMMQSTQLEVFDEFFYQPAVALWKAMGLKTSLALAAVYDTCLQSTEQHVWMHRQTFGHLPPSLGGDEHAWVGAYLRSRNHWLSTWVCTDETLTQEERDERTERLQFTERRSQVLLDLVAANNWKLATPIVIDQYGYNARIDQ